MMKDMLPEKEERDLADRSEQGDRVGRSGSEARALRCYARHRHLLRSVPVPEFDAAALSRRMRAEWNRGWWWQLRLPRRVPRPVFAASCVAIVCAATVSIGWFFRPPNPVQEVRLAADAGTSGPAVSWWWRQRLQWGKEVRMPRDVHAEIRLVDRSTISCSPGTQIAVRFSTERHIALNSGVIIVQAAQDPRSPMIVETPLGTVKVIGTIFKVEVIR